MVALLRSSMWESIEIGRFCEARGTGFFMELFLFWVCSATTAIRRNFVAFWMQRPLSTTQWPSWLDAWVNDRAGPEAIRNRSYAFNRIAPKGLGVGIGISCNVRGKNYGIQLGERTIGR